MLIYLDNCCFNRPYDDQAQIRVFLESQAKMHIQDLIRNGFLELATSFVLIYENTKNPYELKKSSIGDFMNKNASVFIDESYYNHVVAMSGEISKTGIKSNDAYHIACAILANCEYFITTDDRLLKYHTDKLKIVNPLEFIRQIGGTDND